VTAEEAIALYLRRIGEAQALSELHCGSKEEVSKRLAEIRGRILDVIEQEPAFLVFLALAETAFAMFEAFEAQDTWERHQ